MHAFLGFESSFSLRLQQDCLAKALVAVSVWLWLVYLTLWRLDPFLVYCVFLDDIPSFWNSWKLLILGGRVSMDFQKMLTDILAQALVESLHISLVATLFLEPRLGRWCVPSIG